MELTNSQQEALKIIASHRYYYRRYGAISPRTLNRLCELGLIRYRIDKDRQERYSIKENQHNEQQRDYFKGAGNISHAVNGRLLQTAKGNAKGGVG